MKISTGEGGNLWLFGGKGLQAEKTVSEKILERDTPGMFKKQVGDHYYGAKWKKNRVIKVVTKLAKDQNREGHTS